MKCGLRSMNFGHTVQRDAPSMRSRGACGLTVFESVEPVETIAAKDQWTRKRRRVNMTTSYLRDLFAGQTQRNKGGVVTRKELGGAVRVETVRVPGGNGNSPLEGGHSRGLGRNVSALLAAGLTGASVVASVAVSVPSASAAPKRSLLGGTAYDPQGLVQNNSSIHGNITANGAITPSEAYTRAQAWIAARVPYNQGATYPAPDNPVGPYRTDCSGFVSMAWGLSQSLTTQTLPHVATQIAASQLQEGDILDYNSTINPGNGSHVVMFVGWANSQHTMYTEDEEAGGLGAVQRTIPFPYDAAMDGSGSWIPYRYNNMVEGAPAPTAVSMARTSDGKGYWLVSSQGAVYSYGDAEYYGGGRIPGTSPGVKPRSASRRLPMARAIGSWPTTGRSSVLATAPTTVEQTPGT